jgi:hypothetical protein
VSPWTLPLAIGGGLISAKLLGSAGKFLRGGAAVATRGASKISPEVTKIMKRYKPMDGYPLPKQASINPDTSIDTSIIRALGLLARQ